MSHDISPRMSTSWGFDLDMAAVRLMRRDAGDWQEFAVEKIEGADIEDRLMAMVQRIEGDAPVELFLPRDQILYTDVDVSSEDDALPEIEKALERRTPYALSELDFDWEMVSADKARVAAIALETLDEAAAFAEVRNLRVGGFSSLAAPGDFPRMPDFSGHSVFNQELEDEGGDTEPVQFATSREVSKPLSKTAGLTPVASGDASREPVIKVEDSQPVMQFRPRSEPPLDPGTPISTPSTEPRVRTDIAAAAVSEQVASLTPKPSVNVRRSGQTVIRTAAVFGIALLLTIGIAMLVWRLLPLGPSDAPVSVAPEPEAEQSAVMPQPEAEVDVAVVAPTENAAPDPESAPQPDLPVPEVLAEVLAVKAPETDEVPVFVALMAPEFNHQTPKLLTALKSGEGLPEYDPSVPDASAPQQFAEILTVAPFPGPAPTEEVKETTASLSLASVDRNDLFFDAIALPPMEALVDDRLPVRGGQNTEAEVARLDTTATETLPTVADPAPEPANALPRPTELAAALPETAPRARPDGFAKTLERRKFGGRTQAELAIVRPPARPASAQVVATRDTAPEATGLAVDASLTPRGRPRDFDAIVASTRVQQQAARVTASVEFRTPDTSEAIEAALESDAEPEVTAPAPQLSIPSSASVARQATVQNAIRLNRVNLIGVYGTTADRRALVRLPSGRYIKVKVGDRVDGGTVARITDSELLYRKGNRTLALSIPKG